MSSYFFGAERKDSLNPLAESVAEIKRRKMGAEN
jgi:hypothetical protein